MLISIIIGQSADPLMTITKNSTIFGNLLVKQHHHTIKSLSVFGRQENILFMVFNSILKKLFSNGKFIVTSLMTALKWPKLLQIVLLKRQDNQRISTQVNLISNQQTFTTTKLIQPQWVSAEFISSIKQNLQFQRFKAIALRFKTHNLLFSRMFGQEIQAEV